jgi:hypothetical protein
MTKQELEPNNVRARDAREDQRTRAITLLGAFALILLLPVTLVVQFHSNVTAVFAGAIAWVIAQVLKILAHVIVSRMLRRVGPTEAASARGFVSAASELGVAGAFFLSGLPSRIPDVIAFGAGASAIEIILLLLTGGVRRRRTLDSDPRRRIGRRTGRVRYAFLLERSTALALHVGSRCLLYVGVMQHRPAAVACAVLSFSAVDGVAAYGKLEGWNWSDPRISRRYYAFVFMVGALNLGIFAAILKFSAV